MMKNGKLLEKLLMPKILKNTLSSINQVSNRITKTIARFALVINILCEQSTQVHVTVLIRFAQLNIKPLFVVRMNLK